MEKDATVLDGSMDLLGESFQFGLLPVLAWPLVPIAHRYRLTKWIQTFIVDSPGVMRWLLESFDGKLHGLPLVGSLIWEIGSLARCMIGTVESSSVAECTYPRHLSNDGMPFIGNTNTQNYLRHRDLTPFQHYGFTVGADSCTGYGVWLLADMNVYPFALSTSDSLMSLDEASWSSVFESLTSTRVQSAPSVGYPSASFVSDGVSDSVEVTIRSFKIINESDQHEHPGIIQNIGRAAVYALVLEIFQKLMSDEEIHDSIHMVGQLGGSYYPGPLMFEPTTRQTELSSKYLDKMRSTLQDDDHFVLQLLRSILLGTADNASVSRYLSLAGNSLLLHKVMSMAMKIGLELGEVTVPHQRPYDLVVSMRFIFEFLGLPGEAQMIDRYVETLADILVDPEYGFGSSIQALDRVDASVMHIIIFALIILHTDTFNTRVKRKAKMTKLQFVKNLSNPLGISAVQLEGPKFIEIQSIHLALGELFDSVQLGVPWKNRGQWLVASEALVQDVSNYFNLLSNTFAATSCAVSQNYWTTDDQTSMVSAVANTFVRRSTNGMLVQSNFVGVDYRGNISGPTVRSSSDRCLISNLMNSSLPRAKSNQPGFSVVDFDASAEMTGNTSEGQSFGEYSAVSQSRRPLLYQSIDAGNALGLPPCPEEWLPGESSVHRGGVPPPWSRYATTKPASWLSLNAQRNRNYLNYRRICQARLVAWRKLMDMVVPRSCLRGSARDDTLFHSTVLLPLVHLLTETVQASPYLGGGQRAFESAISTVYPETTFLWPYLIGDPSLKRDSVWWDAKSDHDECQIIPCTTTASALKMASELLQILLSSDATHLECFSLSGRALLLTLYGCSTSLCPILVPPLVPRITHYSTLTQSDDSSGDTPVRGRAAGVLSPQSALLNVILHVIELSSTLNLGMADCLLMVDVLHSLLAAVKYSETLFYTITKPYMPVFGQGFPIVWLLYRLQAPTDQPSTVFVPAWTTFPPPPPVSASCTSPSKRGGSKAIKSECSFFRGLSQFVWGGVRSNSLYHTLILGECPEEWLAKDMLITRAPTADVGDVSHLVNIMRTPSLTLTANGEMHLQQEMDLLRASNNIASFHDNRSISPSDPLGSVEFYSAGRAAGNDCTLITVLNTVGSGSEATISVFSPIDIRTSIAADEKVNARLARHRLESIMDDSRGNPTLELTSILLKKPSSVKDLMMVEAATGVILESWGSEVQSFLSPSFFLLFDDSEIRPPATPSADLSLLDVIVHLTDMMVAGEFDKELQRRFLLWVLGPLVVGSTAHNCESTAQWGLKIFLKVLEWSLKDPACLIQDDILALLESMIIMMPSVQLDDMQLTGAVEILGEQFLLRHLTLLDSFLESLDPENATYSSFIDALLPYTHFVLLCLITLRGSSKSLMDNLLPTLSEPSREKIQQVDQILTLLREEPNEVIIELSQQVSRRVYLMLSKLFYRKDDDFTIWAKMTCDRQKLKEVFSLLIVSTSAAWPVGPHVGTTDDSLKSDEDQNRLSFTPNAFSISSLGIRLIQAVINLCLDAGDSLNNILLEKPFGMEEAASIADEGDLGMEPLKCRLTSIIKGATTMASISQADLPDALSENGAPAVLLFMQILLSSDVLADSSVSALARWSLIKISLTSTALFHSVGKSSQTCHNIEALLENLWQLCRSAFADTSLYSETTRPSTLADIDPCVIAIYEAPLQDNIIMSRKTILRWATDSPQVDDLLNLFIASMILLISLTACEIRKTGTGSTSTQWLAIIRRKCTQMLFRIDSYALTECESPDDGENQFPLEEAIKSWRISLSPLFDLLHEFFEDSFSAINLNDDGGIAIGEHLSYEILQRCGPKQGLTPLVQPIGLLSRLGLEIVRLTLHPSTFELDKHTQPETAELAEWLELMTLLNDVFMFSLPVALIQFGLPSSEEVQPWSSHWHTDPKVTVRKSNKVLLSEGPKLKWNDLLPFQESIVSAQCTLQSRWVSIACEVLNWYPCDCRLSLITLFPKNLIISYLVPHLFNRQVLLRIHLHDVGFIKELNRVSALFKQEKSSLRLMTKFLIQHITDTPDERWSSECHIVMTTYLSLFRHALLRIQKLEKSTPNLPPHLKDYIDFALPKERVAKSSTANQSKKVRHEFIVLLERLVLERRTEQIRKELILMRLTLSNKLATAVGPLSKRNVGMDTMMTLYSFLVCAVNSDDVIFRNHICQELLRLGSQVMFMSTIPSSPELLVTSSPTNLTDSGCLSSPVHRYDNISYESSNEDSDFTDLNSDEEVDVRS
eukprot:GHVH01015543.1.p1 GENE.GHVH01015543.1~~GHVH01015543.1.p1  ORF type:complete len:2256 (+),score=323.46 GHVH01015543.1:1908-8675(+)